MSGRCPGPETLARLADGSATLKDADELAHHLDDCPHCRASLETLMSAPSDGTATVEHRGPPESGPPARSFQVTRPASAGSSSTEENFETRVPREPSSLANPVPPALPGYEVIRVLGRGGMGVVYLARQIRADRLVALKVILSARDATSVNQVRFRIEGEALARLRHPNIVQVHEVGGIEDTPFLALEYIDGGNLSELMTAGLPTARRAAELVEILARAIHAAHQEGIIHRDLKPGNVLLARDPDAPEDPARLVPKITDFGLAKRVGTESGLTQTGEVLGTPSYMAPEQASGNAHVGIPADVYALGAILYALLAGRPPFRAESPWATIMQVIHDAPPPPSRHRPGLARDLEVICLKSLAKEPGDRYAGAHALAEDLRRWLADEPIRARPAGPARRLALWCRRRPVPAALAGLLLLAILGGAVGVLIQWRRAEASLEKSDHRFDLAVAAIDNFTHGVSKDLLLQRPEFVDLRGSLLRQSLSFFRELRRELEAGGPEDRPFRERLLNSVVALAKNTASQVANRRLALEINGEAVAIADALLAEDPGSDNARRERSFAQLHRGELLAELGRVDEARSALKDSADGFAALARVGPDRHNDRNGQAGCLHTLGDLDCDAERFVESEADYRRALAIRRDLVASHPEVVKYWGELGATSSNLGYMELRRAQPLAAIEVLRESVEANRRLLTLLEVESNESAKSQAARKLVVGRGDTALNARRKLGDSLTTLAEALVESGRHAEARETLTAALQIQELLVKEYVGVPLHRADLATSLRHLAVIDRAEGRPEAAGLDLERARMLDRALVDEEGHEVADQIRLTRDLLIGGELASSGADPDRAARTFLEAAEIAASLPDRHAETISLRAWALRGLGKSRAALGRLGPAASALRSALELFRDDPTAPEPRFQRALVHAELGSLLARSGSPGELDEALRRLRSAVRELSQVAENCPDVVRYREALEYCRGSLARLEDRAGATDPSTNADKSD